MPLLEHFFCEWSYTTDPTRQENPAAPCVVSTTNRFLAPGAWCHGRQAARLSLGSCGACRIVGIVLASMRGTMTTTLTPFEKTVLDRINHTSAFTLGRELNRTEQAVWAAITRANRKVLAERMLLVAKHDRSVFPTV